jgi:tetratricopeptide (TPR) repeat protein
MQLRNISLAILIALVASSATTLSCNVAALSQSKRVLAQSTDIRKQEADKLIQQGVNQCQLSQYEAGLRSFQQALSIYRSIKDRGGEGNALDQMGVVYNLLGNYNKAIESH